MLPNHDEGMAGCILYFTVLNCLKGLSKRSIGKSISTETIEVLYMRRLFWKFCYLLGYTAGGAGMTAVGLDLLLFRQNVFNTAEMTEFLFLIVFAFLIKRFIYPRYV